MDGSRSVHLSVSPSINLLFGRVDHLAGLRPSASHWLLYALMVAMPLVGWAMLARSLRLFSIAPHDIGLYGILRQAHTVLGIALFLVFLAHMSAALLHALVRGDGVFDSVALHPFRRRAARP